MTPRADAHAGQAVYTPMTLKFYDLAVLRISNQFLWRCPTRDLLAMYERNISAKHLDVGVGTGYFLNNAEWPVPEPNITLLDLNASSLAAASARIARFTPKTITANILEPLNFSEKFSSVGLCYLLHCLPGTMIEKARAFDHIKQAMEPGGKVFGATILQSGPGLSKPARTLMDFYNHKGIFSNTLDTLDVLKDELEKRFVNVTVTPKGAVAIFEAENRS